MSRFAEMFADRPMLADGAMGTVLYARGVFINRCYEELNLSDPNLILSVHEEYLQAGAEILETNTFGANRFRLTRHGLSGKVEEINAAGVRLARQAVEHLKEKQAGEAWVAGSVGPLGVRLEPLGKTGLDEARAAFAEQIGVLARGGPGIGVDLLIIETMPALNEAREALEAAKAVAPHLPVLVMVTVDDESECLDGSSPAQAAALLTEWGAGAVGVNCSTGPATVLTAIEAMRAATTLPLGGHAQCGHAAGCGRTQYLSLFARVHGQLRAQGHHRGSADCGRLLRHHAESHPRHALGHSRHGRAGSRGEGQARRRRSAKRRRRRHWRNALALAR